MQHEQPSVSDPDADSKAKLARAAAKVAGWLRHLIDPDQVVELRALKVQDGTKGGSTWAGTFLGAELEQLAESALQLSGLCSAVYYTLNPLKPDRHVRQAPRVRKAGKGDTAKDTDVVERRWLPIDVDPVKADGHTHDSATDAEKARTLDLARRVMMLGAELGWPAPILCDSGNGHHLLYRLADPLPAGRAPDDDPLRLVMQQLAELFDGPDGTIDTSLYNPARILKLPGTLACKGENTTDRPHRRARVLEVPEAGVGRVTAGQLDALTARVAASRSRVGAGGRLGGGDDLDKLIQRGEALARIKNPSIDGSNGHDDLMDACRDIYYGLDLPKEIAFRILWDIFNPRCQGPWTEAQILYKLKQVDEVPFPKQRGYLRESGRKSGGRQTRALPVGGDGEPMSLVEKDDDPHRLAGVFLESLSPDGPPYPLRYWRGEFHRYAGGAYTALPEDDLRAQVTAAIRAEFEHLHALELASWSQAGGKGDAPELRTVTRSLVGNVLQAMTGVCLLPASVDAPAWVDGATGPAPETILPVANGLLDLTAAAAGQLDALLPPSASFFTPTASPFRFDPSPPPPANWLRFLADLWPGDTESVRTLQEWFGYLLTPDTSQQKVLFLVGPKRGGKGTLARVLRELVGPGNFAGPTLGSLTSNFGLSALLGRSVAVISDARFSGRPGDAATIVERMLAISGEDAITVDRKHKDLLTVKLPTRFVLLSNELPRLTDSSGALCGRMILLRLTRSWFGAEDTGLGDRLRAELPGILLWAIEGWRRLRERGRFVQPESGRQLIRSMEDISSPVGAFLRERCLLRPGEEIQKSELYAAWQSWCEDHGKREPGTDAAFGQHLYAAAPTLGEKRPRDKETKKRVQMYTGIRLRDENKDKDDDPDFDSLVRVGQGGQGDPQLHAQEEREDVGEALGGDTTLVSNAIAGHPDHPDHPDHADPLAALRH